MIVDAAAPAEVLARLFADEISVLLELIDRLGCDELRQAAQSRMRTLPDRVALDPAPPGPVH